MNEWWFIVLLLTLGAVISMLMIRPLRLTKKGHIFLSVIVLMLALGGYFYWGGFKLWQAYLHHTALQQQAQRVLKTIKSPDELIAKLKEKIAQNPQNAKGWYLLGRLYAAQRDYDHAFLAFKKAYRLSPNNEQYVVNYVHSLWQRNNQQLNERGLTILNKLLETNPQQPDALSMLAMNAYLKKDYQQAISFWQRLLPLVAEHTEESEAIRQAIVKAERKIVKVEE